MRPDDPELIARLLEFNAGVARARAEYNEPHRIDYGHGQRICTECGDNHKSKRHELCWRCMPAKGPKA